MKILMALKMKVGKDSLVMLEARKSCSFASHCSSGQEVVGITGIISELRIQSTGQPKCSQIFGMSLGNGGYWEAPDMYEYW